MLKKIISGGQTGADRAAFDVAIHISDRIIYEPADKLKLFVLGGEYGIDRRSIPKKQPTR